MKRIVAAIAVLTSLVTLNACQSKHEEGVTSNYRTQWTNVMADTAATTDAAKSVLMTENLKDVIASSTAVDGMAMAKESDGTKVDVSVKKKTDTTSEVSVVVGKLGDPALGAEIAKKIKMRAEGH